MVGDSNLEKLKRVPLPEPSEEARDRAVRLALDAFDC